MIMVRSHMTGNGIRLKLAVEYGDKSLQPCI